MKIKDLQVLKGLLVDYQDFFMHHADGDETGLIEEVETEMIKANKIIEDELYKNHLRNALARGRRKRK